MTDWHPDAFEEVARYARSRQRSASQTAGRMVEEAFRLTDWRLKSLPRLPGRHPEIRWWERNGMAMYIRVAPPPVLVVKVGRITTQKLRDDCESSARERSTT